MEESITFVRYAEECRRLAKKMQDEKLILLEMADAWLRCADEVERTVETSDSADSSGG